MLQVSVPSIAWWAQKWGLVMLSSAQAKFWKALTESLRVLLGGKPLDRSSIFFMYSLSKSGMKTVSNLI